MTNARLIINTQRISRFGMQFSEAQKWLDNEVLKDSDPFVPMDSSNLRTSGIRGTTLGSGRIVYNAPYATKQYYQYPNKSRDKHPQACTQWFEKAKAIHKDRWIKTAKKIAGGGAK